MKKKDFIIEIKENISKINQTKVKSAISLLTKQKKITKLYLLEMVLVHQYQVMFL
jgi:hypothetical protein